MKVFRISLCFVFLLMSIQAFAQEVNPEILRLQALLEEPQKLKEPVGPFGLTFKGRVDGVSPFTALQANLSGTFWRNPEWVKVFELTTDQQNKMDDIYQQYRLKLIDLTASLQKEELTLEPLLGKTRPTPDAEAKILTQIDRIAQSRAELEKANSRMLMSLLQVLTADQWTKLPAQVPKKGLLFKQGVIGK